MSTPTPLSAAPDVRIETLRMANKAPANIATRGRLMPLLFGFASSISSVRWDVSVMISLLQIIDRLRAAQPGLAWSEYQVGTDTFIHIHRRWNESRSILAETEGGELPSTGDRSGGSRRTQGFFSCTRFDAQVLRFWQERFIDGITSGSR